MQPHIAGCNPTLHLHVRHQGQHGRVANIPTVDRLQRETDYDEGREPHPREQREYHSVLPVQEEAAGPVMADLGKEQREYFVPADRGSEAFTDQPALEPAFVDVSE